jgi:hypothetical protein
MRRVMAEAKEEVRETIQDVKRAFNLLSVTVFSLLLVSALICQIPYKVSALLLIFLLASTALPKKFRKWFWAGIGVIVLISVIWVFLPEDDEDWRPYIFDEEIANIEARYGVPDEENAALIYYEIMDKFDVNSLGDYFSYFDNNTRRTMYDNFWLSEEYPKAAKWIEGQKETMDLLRQVSRYEKCRFPIVSNYHKAGQPPRNFDELNQVIFRPVYPIYHLGLFLLLAANNDIGEGRINDGLEKYKMALQVGKHIRQGHGYSDILMGTAVESRVYRQLNLFLVNKEPREKHVRYVTDYLKTIEYDWDSDFRKILEDEKLSSKSMFCSMGYQTNSQGDIRLNQDPNSTIRNIFSSYGGLSNIVTSSIIYKLGNSFERRFTKAEAFLCWFLMPSNPEKAGVIIEESVEKIWTMDETEQESFRKAIYNPPFNYAYYVENLLYYFLSSCDSVYKHYHERATRHKGCQVMAAISLYKNRYGHWPESLEHLKGFAEPGIFLDGFNSTPFIYKLTGDSFKLYSAGLNNIDEDGKYSADHAISLRGGPGTLRYKKDDILIWPIMDPCDSEEND